MSELEAWYQRWPTLFIEGAWYQLPDGTPMQARASYQRGAKDWPVTWGLYLKGAAVPVLSVTWETIPPSVFRRDHGGHLGWSGLSLEDIQLVKRQE
jgi:hypothetical protein